MPELSYRSSYPVRVLQCITLGGDCTAQSHARTPLPMALTGSDSSRHYPYAGTSLTALASLIALVPFLVPSHLCAFRQQELTGPWRRPFRETCSSRARQSWVRAPHPMMSVVPSHHALLPPPPPRSPATARTVTRSIQMCACVSLLIVLQLKNENLPYHLSFFIVFMEYTALRSMH